METVTESDTTILTDTTTSIDDSLSVFTTNSINYNVTEVPESVYKSFQNFTSNQHELQPYSRVFETFIILEIVMTAIELLLSTAAALKISRWMRNYRNQMLLQLSITRFIKRMIFFIQFTTEKYETDSSGKLKILLISSEIYIDFVIIILICFFIKHMYDSLIIVIVNIRKESLYSVICCSWLIPVPLSGIWTAVICTHLLKEQIAYLVICALLRWPLILLGTLLYLTVLYKVLTDKIRRFARSLTVVTFFLCLVVNLYLFSRDVIKLWCSTSVTTVIASYILGFILNALILCLYIILITLNFKSQTKSCNTLPNYSSATVK